MLRPWALALSAALTVACVTRSTVRPYVPSEESGAVKLHLRDGRLVVLDAWEIEGDEIRGPGREYGVERDILRGGTISVPRTDVALVETTEKQLNPAVIPMAVVTGASLAFTVFCLTNNKACFGSCPTFYVPDGRGAWALQAEGFSSSIARTLEADDVDDLPDARPQGGALTIAMRNEALETHQIRALSLLAVRGPEGSTVVRGFRDTFLAVGPSVPPADADHAEIRDALAERDAKEVRLESDGVNLANRDSLLLQYPAPGKRDVALVLTARNSLMSTYVFYQMIALHGRGYGAWLASLERGDVDAVMRVLEFNRLLGGVDVQVRQHGGDWKLAGSLGYIGPIARATRAVSFEVEFPYDPVEVRLDFARAHWALDAARLAPVLAARLQPEEVPPEVVAAKGRDLAAVTASLRGRGERVVTLPGDEILLRFPVPEARGGSVGYFLRSRGFYYEWMRDEWAREEDQGRARAYLADPARALRELAPGYHAVEPSMESVFRASRFWRPAAP